MFRCRETREELMDDLTLEGEALRKNLDELEFINYWLGGNKVITNALSKLSKHFARLNKPVEIADLGCGGGDILRVCAKWALRKNTEFSLTGIDANAFMIRYAQDKCRNSPAISFQQLNIFSPEFSRLNFDVIICSLFCHHFSDATLIQLFRQLNRQANVAVVINDIHRHPLAYYSIKWLTSVFSGSYLVKNDAPLSVLRAFKRKELETMLQQAGVSNYKLIWKWAFRWQLIIYT